MGSPKNFAQWSNCHISRSSMSYEGTKIEQKAVNRKVQQGTEVCFCEGILTVKNKRIARGGSIQTYFARFLDHPMVGKVKFRLFLSSFAAGRCGMNGRQRRRPFWRKCWVEVWDFAPEISCNSTLICGELHGCVVLNLHLLLEVVEDVWKSIIGAKPRVCFPLPVFLNIHELFIFILFRMPFVTTVFWGISQLPGWGWSVAHSRDCGGARPFFACENRWNMYPRHPGPPPRKTFGPPKPT